MCKIVTSARQQNSPGTSTARHNFNTICTKRLCRNFRHQLQGFCTSRLSWKQPGKKNHDCFQSLSLESFSLHTVQHSWKETFNPLCSIFWFLRRLPKDCLLSCLYSSTNKNGVFQSKGNQRCTKTAVPDIDTRWSTSTTI